MLLQIIIVLSYHLFPTGELLAQVSLFPLARLLCWLNNLHPRSEADKSRLQALKIIESLIKDAESTLADLKQLNADKQLIQDYEKELADLYNLRKKLRNKED